MISTTLFPLVEKLSTLLSAHPDHPVLVALDGRCGSGKTTLAAQLARQFPQSITVHTDDFYLPPASRVANWEQIPCANMDLERLRAQVLTPARTGQAVPYRAYSCRAGAYLPEQCFAPQPLVIVEGSYSCHPTLAVCSIWNFAKYPSSSGIHRAAKLAYRSPSRACRRRVCSSFAQVRNTRSVS